MEETAFDPRRRLCPDGSCVGVLGADGRCSVCQRPVGAGGESLAEAPAEAWTAAERIRQLIAAVERRAASGEAGMSAGVEARTRWAKQVADGLDPFGAGVDALSRRHEEAAETAGRSLPYGF